MTQHEIPKPPAFAALGSMRGVTAGVVLTVVVMLAVVGAVTVVGQLRFGGTVSAGELHGTGGRASGPPAMMTAQGQPELRRDGATVR